MIICADDFGLSEDVDQAILELCAVKRLSAVSCMAALRSCSAGSLKQLLRHQNDIDIGLHLCLADPALRIVVRDREKESEEQLPAFSVYLRRALAGRVSATESASQIAAQYEMFVAKCGRRPDYIDGHLHTHQLAGARQGLLQFVRGLPNDSRPYLRNTCQPLASLRKHRLPWLKAASIGFFGRQMLRESRAAGVATNEGFAGIYDFRHWPRYPDYFPNFAACLGHRNGILVVHPGKLEDWRRQEFTTLRESAVVSNRFQRADPV